MSTPRAKKVSQYAAALGKLGMHPKAVRDWSAEAETALAAGRDFDQAAHLNALTAIVRAAPPDFALRFGAQRRLADMGLVGHAIRSAGTSRHAFDIWTNFSHLTGEPFGFHGSVEGASWRLEMKPAAILPSPVARFCVEEMTASFFALALELAPLDVAAARTEFRHQRRANLDYAQSIPGEIRFGCPKDVIFMPVAALDTPARARDDEMLDALVSHMTQNNARDVQGGMVGQVRYLLMSSGTPPPKLIDAAHRLGVSARTLNRRLAEEGATYRQLVKDFRCEYVQALARETGASAKQLAFAAGYRNDQSLRRAFRAWTRTPLREWTKRERAKPASNRPG